MNAVERWQAYMRDGDFESAWKISDVVRPAVWDRTPLHGSRVQIECLHGLGDTILFARFFPMVADIAKSVTVAVQPELERLLAHIPGVKIGRCPADVTVECTELAYVFRTTVGTIPRDVPYIRIDRCRSSGGRRVGLVWASGVYNPLRSLALADLAPLADVVGIQWTALQHGPAFAEARAHGQPFGFHDAPDPTGADALDTALRILDLDLVITPDTMVAHLAGALGVATWTLLPFEADWRWLRDRDDSPWYPTMRLFRQRGPGDWADVVRRVAQALARPPQPLRAGLLSEIERRD